MADVNARALCFLVGLGLVSGSAQSGEGSVGGLGLLDSLSGTGVALLGLARAGSEKELADVLAVTWKRKLSVLGAPTCAFDAYAKVEQIVVRIDQFTSLAGVFAARGRGLRAAVEGCLKSAAPSASIRQNGVVTRYQVGAKALHVVWIDDSTVLGGPIDDDVATAALAGHAGSAPNRSRIRSLLGKADVRSKAWIAVDIGAIEKWPADAPRPSVAWGQIVDATLKATATFASADDARKVAELLRERLKATRGLDTSEIVLAVDGAHLVAKVPIATAWAPGISRLLGAPIPPQLVPNVMAVGPIAALLDRALGEDHHAKP